MCYSVMDQTPSAKYWPQVLQKYYANTQRLLKKMILIQEQLLSAVKQQQSSYFK